MNSFRKYFLPIGTILVLSILFLLHKYGMDGDWYLHYPYLDIINHILGGIGIAMALLFVLKNPKYIILLTFIAGVAWELFEIYYDISGWRVGTLQYNIDTIKDLLNDTLGSIIVWLIAKYKK